MSLAGAQRMLAPQRQQRFDISRTTAPRHGTNPQIDQPATVIRTRSEPDAQVGMSDALLARVTGLEPATSGVTGRRSNQLSYTRSSSGSV